MNKRFLYGIICIVLAAAIAFIGIPLLASKANAKTTVIRMKESVSKGSVITASQIEEVEIGSYNLYPGLAVKAEEVSGKYATVDLTAGDYLQKSKLSDSPITPDVVLNHLPAGKLAVSFTVKSLAGGVSDKLQPNDIIRIYHYGEEAEVIPELQYVKVLAVTDSKGQNIDKLHPTGEDDETQLSATVLVLATPAQAKLLIGLENDGVIHVAFITRDAKIAEQLLDAQDQILNSVISEPETDTGE